MQLPNKTISQYWLLLLWLAVSLVQATFSPLDADETYYWMYASRLDWGYYDHPPAVALLISLGKDWLSGALGLRFGHVLAGALTVACMWHLLGKPKGKLLWLAAALIAAQPFLNVYGFIATPDGPLLLFTVLYLLAYRRFLATPDLKSGALWGLTMAGLLYSKYHGLMLIVFTVLPHLLWLLRQPGAWLAALGGAALYVPHLYWQYANDFPSFRYHLSGRDDAYEIKYTLEYIGNQLGIFSPLLVYHYVQTFRKDDDRGDRFARACRWLVIGFLLFFLYTTSKGGTEAQWTALLSVPLAYLTFRAARDRFPEWRTAIFHLAVATIVIIALGRLLLIAPREWLPFPKPFDHEPWTEQLSAEAGDLPVLVQNSYRFASLYEFYAGKPAWTFTDVGYRRNQYDLWSADTAFHNQPVYLFGQRTWEADAAQPFHNGRVNMLTSRVDSFQVIKDVRLSPVNELPERLQTGQSLDVSLLADVPRTLYPRANPIFSFDLFIIFHAPEGEISYWRLPLTDEVLAAGNYKLKASNNFKVPNELSGPYQIEFGFGYRGMPPLRGMSDKWSVLVE